MAHIPGKQNTAADRESRASRRETEWSLNKDIFNAVVSKLGFSPNIDLFASRLNYQVKPYVATHQTQKHMQLMLFICHEECINFMLFLPSALFTKFFKK